MGKIKVLDEDLISKIAAGEVVERPASVVKELIENSIDADAKKIFIEVREGGKGLIKVTDNGDGLDEDDAKLCFQRHTTSKISKAEDLFNIKSLGFRGEALASIAAVSKTAITTKTAAGFEATKLEIQDRKPVQASKTAANKGTIVEVRDLFFNTPARKKHMDTISTESRHITDIVTRYALNYPQIFLKLVQDDKTTINSPSTTNTLSNISNIYGYQFAKQLLAVNYSSGDIEIMGFIGKPSLVKADKSYQSVYVNGRYVKSDIVSNALQDCFHTLIMVSRFPVAILNITIDPKKIDVNVHPTKRSVKFSEDKKVYQAVFDAVRKTLQENDLFAEAEMPEQKILAPKQEEKKKKLDRKSSLEKTQQVILEVKETKLPFKLHGVIDKTYIVAEDKENMLLVDQHAMHERILYERFMKQFMSKDVSVQQLIVPLVLELSATEQNIIQSNIEKFKELGFQVEDFGHNTISVRTMPSIFGRQQEKGIISDIISELNKGKSKKFDEIKEEIITKMACRAAIKAGDDLPVQRVRELLAQLYDTDSPYTCPHGRPILIKFPINELEKRFKRAV